MRKKIIFTMCITYILMTLALTFAKSAVASPAKAYGTSFKIETYTAKGKMTGSGFMVKGFGNYIVTNRHVVQSGEMFATTYIDNIRYDLEVVDISNKYDLAVLKFKNAVPKTPEALPLCSDSNKDLTSVVYNVGHPAGVRYVYNQGYISGSKRTAPFFKTDAKFLITSLNVVYGGQSGSAIIYAKDNCILSVLTGMVPHTNLSFSIEVEALNKYINFVKIKNFINI